MHQHSQQARSSDTDAHSPDAPGLAVAVPRSIRLGQAAELDLSCLTEDQARAMQQKHADGLVEVNRKANEAYVSVSVLDKRLGSLSQTVREAGEAGASATVTTNHQDAYGNTQVMMGNTEAAARGRMTRSQQGLTDETMRYILAGLAALALVAVVVVLKG